MTERVRRCGFRQVEGTAQAGHGKLDDPWRQLSAFCANEGRRVRGAFVGADGKVIRYELQHWKQYRDHAGLVALAGDNDGVALAGSWNVFDLEAEGFRDAQPRSVKQGKYGCVARQHPRLAL